MKHMTIHPMVILLVLLLTIPTVNSSGVRIDEEASDPWWTGDDDLYHHGSNDPPDEGELILGPLRFDPNEMSVSDLEHGYESNLWMITFQTSEDTVKFLGMKQDDLRLREILSPRTLLLHNLEEGYPNCKILRDEVASILPYHPIMKISAPLYEIVNEREGKGTLNLAVGLYYLEPDVIGHLEGLSLTDIDVHPYPYVLTGEFHLHDIMEISARDSVSHVSILPVDGPDNDVAADIIDVSEVHEGLGLNGSGQIVAVVDTGLDTGKNSTMHADIDGRIVSAYAYGRTNDWSDEDIHTWTGSSWDYDGGHGTHVVGSAVGNGSASNGTYSGMAPDAGLVIQSRMTSTGSYKSVAYSTMFRDAYESGARIQTNSWSSRSSYGNYSWQSWQTDHYIWNNPDLTVLFSAGNKGHTVGNHSISTQASSKNVIAVGASENYRSSLGSSADNISQMAYFSSQGYTWGDNRIKPDVVAPGTWILSMRSSLISDYWNHYWGSNSTYNGVNSKYAYLGGTSMSTPIVAGMAALIRQHYEDKEYEEDPSAALIKATIINGARPLNGKWSSVPNRYEGWGRVNLSNSLATEDGDSGRLKYFENETGLKNGEKHSRRISVSGGDSDIIATLVWTDYPGSNTSSTKLINDLDLEIVAPDGSKYLGNDFTSPFNDSRDSSNNVERVRIPSPESGIYWINVSANSVTVGPQKYALVITGDTTDAIATMEWDREYYNGDGGHANLTLTDSNLTGMGWIELKVNTTSDPEGEKVNLTEITRGGVGSGIFLGGINLTLDSPENGEVRVKKDESLTAYYSEKYPPGNVVAEVTVLIPPVINSVYHDAGGKVLTYGDRVVVTINGTPGYWASFSVHNLSEVGTTQAFDDGISPDKIQDDGNYTGVLTVPNYINDTFTVKGYLKRPELPKVHLDSNETIRINTNVPRSPKNLTVFPLPEGNKLMLRWEDPGDVNLMSYLIFRANETESGSGIPDEFTRIHTTPDNRTYHTDTGLENGVRYFYRLSSRNVLGFVSRLTDHDSGVPEDLLPPSVRITSPGDGERIGGNVSVNISGDEDIVRIILEGSADRDANGVPDGSWEILVDDSSPGDNLTWNTESISGSLDDGDRILLRARAYDEADNINVSSVVKGIILDNTPPEGISLLSEDEISLNVDVYNLIARTEGGGRVVVRRNGEKIKEIAVPPDGRVNSYLDLDPGINIFNISVFDSIGNGPVHLNGGLYVVYDNIPPVATPLVEVALNSMPVVLNGSGSYDPGPESDITGVERYVWRVDIRGESDIFYGRRIEMNIEEPGDARIDLTVFDFAGNENTSEIITRVEDDISPALFSKEDMSVSEDQQIQLIHPGYEDNDPDLEVNGYSTWNISGPEDFDLRGWDQSIVIRTPGLYDCLLTVVDSGGNRDSISFKIIVEDLTSPIANAGPDLTAVVGQSVNLSTVYTTDNDPIFPDGANFTWSFSGSNMKLYGMNVTFKPLVPGSLDLTLTVLDRSGNEATDELNIEAVTDGDEPGVVGSVPGEGWMNVTPETDIVVEFDELMNADPIYLEGIELLDEMDISRDIQPKWSDGNTLIIEPNEPLNPGGSYGLILKGLRDRTHSVMDDVIISFSVRPDPEFIGIDVNGMEHVGGEITIGSLPSVVTMKFDNPVIIDGVLLRGDDSEIRPEWELGESTVDIYLEERMEKGSYTIVLESLRGTGQGNVAFPDDIVIKVDTSIGEKEGSDGEDTAHGDFPLIPLLAIPAILMIGSTILLFVFLTKRKGIRSNSHTDGVHGENPEEEKEPSGFDQDGNNIKP